jgi:hypothetical protein
VDDSVKPNLDGLEGFETRPAPGRRAFLALLSVTPVMAIGAFAGHAHAEVCIPETDLTPAEVSVRKSVEFVEVAADKAKACDLCTFFKADKSGCGHCQILGGPVSPPSHCNSWSPRAAV